MSKYTELKDKASDIEKLLQRHVALESNIIGNDPRRYLSDSRSNLFRLPKSLYAKFDELMAEAKQYHEKELEQVKQRLSAVDTLLAGYEAKEGEQ